MSAPDHFLLFLSFFLCVYTTICTLQVMANVTMSGFEDQPLEIVEKISIEDIDETIAADYYVAVMLQVR